MSVPMMWPVATAGIRAFSPEWFSFNGISQSSAIDAYSSLNSFSRAPADEAWVYRCVMLKASFAQGVPLIVYDRKGKSKVPAQESNNTAAKDLQSLLDDANPINMNGSDLRAYTSAALAVWGASYWRKVRGRLGGPPQELYWLRTPDVKAIKDRVWIGGYDHKTAAGATEHYATKDVVAFRRINLLDPTEPLSPLSAARYDLTVDRKAAMWTASTLENWGMPPTAWVIPKDTDFGREDQNLVRRAIRALRGPRNAGKTPILPQGLEPKVLSLNPKDAEWLAARKVSRMTVCAILGVPLVLAGDDEKASVYANMRDAERVFARFMIGELDWAADTLEGWLVPDFDPAPRATRSVCVAFDYSGIEALQAPVEDRKKVALMELERAARTPNEYRSEFSIGDALPAESGDRLLQLSGLVPIDPDTGEQVKPEEPAQPMMPGGPPEGGGNPQTFPPEQTPPTQGNEQNSEQFRHLYRHPVVRAWEAGTGALKDVADLLGVDPTDQLATGLKRRYTHFQLMNGVPAEGFESIRNGHAVAH